MKLRFGVLALVILAGGPAVPVQPKPPAPADAPTVTCAYAYSAAICRGDEVSWPDGAVYRVP